ncbi:uncharacterized protein C8Q71DRAFT_857195 [Rhodofomes roseus]|uniref:Uncharacterized protein n=1 Tax=Rhodofomes roseus TaxID=34475 RepID=A0ABQ8KKL1_9APHY|nr:uncharacterized protein C8Q71DRAFT_857195 [Rhodofomes roseus]KAH9838028.1 hypothetical protein C8Q71DRAFT_857195 [Rhodofomes roseus]
MPSPEGGGVEFMHETNVFGTVKITNAMPPHMRGRKSGLIVFLGQGGTASQHPRASRRSRTKAAVQAISQVIVFLAVPGGFLTSQLDTPYTMTHHQAHLANAIKGEGRAEGMPTPDWLLLGKPTFAQATQLSGKLEESVNTWEGVSSRDLDFDDDVESQCLGQE